LTQHTFQEEAHRMRSQVARHEADTQRPGVGAAREPVRVGPRLRGGAQLDPMSVDAFAAWLQERSRIGDGGVP